MFDYKKKKKSFLFEGDKLEGNSKTLNNEWNWSLTFLRFDDEYVNCL